eukprot:CAMPEP_0113705046 /NCGR_PEP_ID=MMETSP0038_2-20120614/26897_1 /TAXON_ID=2898 /ORGANISM="Cryptomonas paramecium" /LENGTH=92 /DNA_ID=CAMNT_0000629975 /DNA_START=122 /DNA_END=400 /DNA_ORIENTATION=- /assembly_acc=CAM_ASM_000170
MSIASTSCEQDADDLDGSFRDNLRTTPSLTPIKEHQVDVSWISSYVTPANVRPSPMEYSLIDEVYSEDGWHLVDWKWECGSPPLAKGEVFPL